MRFTRFAHAAIAETASYLPERVVTTHALDPARAAELIRLTGVEARHVAADEQATSDLCIVVARSPLTPESVPTIDRVLVATVTPDHPSPATAPLVQHALGLAHVPAMDLSAACAGYVYALDLAARAVATGDRAVLVTAGECRFRTLTDAAPGVRVLFGDGATAARVVASGPLRIVATMLGADGSGHDQVRVAAGGSRLAASPATLAEGLHALRMADGPHVFYRAVEGFIALATTFLAALSLTPADIDLVVPHQANLRILERVARITRIPLERFVIVVDRYGNVGGASAGIALDHAWRAGRIQAGQRVLLLTAGAGYTAGAALLEAT